MQTNETTNCTNLTRDFVITNFLFGDASSLQDDTSFMGSGIIDSTGILELVMFVESTFEIKVQPEEMLPENLDSVNHVAAFVARKLPAKAGVAA
jgi:acyl carrier protein